MNEFESVCFPAGLSSLTRDQLLSIRTIFQLKSRGESLCVRIGVETDEDMKQVIELKREGRWDAGGK